MPVGRRLLLAAPLLAAIRPARAQEGALRVTWRDGVTGLDPYYNPQRTAYALAHEAWDTLIFRDPDTLELKPLLASSWRRVDQLTLEFELRRDVVFHDGSRFSAADVVYTLGRVRDDPQVAVPGSFDWLDSAVALDEFHVRLRLRHIFPAALEYIALLLPIWPAAYRERVGADGYARAPVGAGPYRVRELDADRIVLERHEAYYGGAKGRPAIARVEIRQVRDDRAEVEDLLAGRTDWIWMFSPQQEDAIGRDGALRTAEVDSLRFDYLAFDAAGPGDRGPLGRPRVRQAIAHAIDRQKLASPPLQSGGRALDAPCYPSQFGCEQSAAIRYPYDPAAARQLLAEEGLGRGFATDLVSYVLPAFTEAVRTDLAMVGIHATVAQLPVADALRRFERGGAPLFMGSWGSYSINDVAAVLPYFFAGGPADTIRDAALEAMVREAVGSPDADERRRACAAAIQRITERAYFLPLTTRPSTYAWSRALAFRPMADELPRFFRARWQ